jgi:DNA-binding beta-propeller fold protein YncE
VSSGLQPARVGQSSRGARQAFWLALPSSAMAVLGILAASVLASPLLVPRLTLWGYSDGVALQEPRGVTFDPRDGALYVSNTGAHRIEVFSAAGRPLARFVHRVTGPGGDVVDGLPCALAFDRSGRLLVVDQLARYVDVLDRRGRSWTRLVVPAGHPSAVAVAPDGTIYVGTSGEDSKVHRFRPDYSADGAWGEAGFAPGLLMHVAALAALGDSAIAVACERSVVTVQVFGTDGRFQRGFGTHDVGHENFSLPSGLAATADGRIWATDDIRRALQVFDREGNLLARLEGGGTATAEFGHPSALACDGRGLVAVADRELGRVQVFAIADLHEGMAANRP